MGANFRGSKIGVFSSIDMRARGEMDITGASEASSAGSIPAGRKQFLAIARSEPTAWLASGIERRSVAERAREAASRGRGLDRAAARERAVANSLPAH